MPYEVQFAYGIGRIRVIEKQLIDKAKLERMVESKTIEEALKVLYEAGYNSVEADNNVFSYEYERLIKEEQKNLYNLMKEITKESEVIDIFLLSNDYHNIKVLLKSEFLGLENNDNLLEVTTIPEESLKTILKERDFNNLPSHMKDAIEECIDAFGKTRDPRLIDLILDKTYFMHALELSKNMGILFVEELLEIIIDITNIKTFLRIKKLSMSAEFMEQNLIPGGKIDNNIFVTCFGLSLDKFMEYMKGYPYKDICEKGIEYINTTNSIAMFEKLADDYLIMHVKRFKYKTLGIEPLIGYLLAKENEFKNIRIVMVGKINNLPINIIKERLRETYV